MCLAQGPQRSDAGEARTRSLSIWSQALYHWGTVLPHTQLSWALKFYNLKAGVDNKAQSNQQWLLRYGSWKMDRQTDAAKIISILISKI